jgi:membrane protein implicated in regulation of membrane protease activity
VVSAKIKFIAITIDELVLVPIAFILVYFFLPEILLPIIVIGVIGSAIFVVIKYYLVYPSLQETTAGQYDVHGLTGYVTSTVTQKSGKVKVGQEIWDARTDEGSIEPGTEIVITSRESLRVRVRVKEE